MFFTTSTIGSNYRKVLASNQIAFSAAGELCAMRSPLPHALVCEEPARTSSVTEDVFYSKNMHQLSKQTSNFPPLITSSLFLTLRSKTEEMKSDFQIKNTATFYTAGH